MNIRKACLQAQKEGRGITRKSYGSRPMMLIPTNTNECVVIIPFNESQPKSVRWNPNLDDLVADDWYVYG